jgi:hypothetical protein
VFGGHDGSTRLGDMHAYDFLSNRWSQVPSAGGPTPRHSHTLAAMTGPGPVSERIFMFGGYDGNYRADVWTLTVATHKWQKAITTGHGPSPRYRSSLVVCRDLLVVFGGHDGTRHLEVSAVCLSWGADRAGAAACRTCTLWTRKRAGGAK